MNEDLAHILASCIAYSSIRDRFKSQYHSLCEKAKTHINLQDIYSDKESFCQFVLDPGSYNLSNRIHIDDPILSALFQLSRDYCYAVNSARKKILAEKLKK